MTEDELIRRFVRRFPGRGRGLRLGPGDDCAILRPSPGRELCATTDSVVEGVHFDSRFSPEDVGHKALAVNLSDLAAMGAAPRWFLLAIELPPRQAVQWLDGLARGMAPLARAHGCVLAGGNVSRGPHFSVTITAFGEVPRGRALRRDGLRAGDVIAVTGTLGAAALGLRMLAGTPVPWQGRGGLPRAAPPFPHQARGGSSRDSSFPRNERGGLARGSLQRGRPESPPLPQRWRGRVRGPGITAPQLRPTPRVRAGLAARGLASAAMDISDGLALDLSRMCAASGCGAELWSSALPAGREVRAQPDWLQLCLTGGEDYELLLGVRPGRWPALERRVAASGTAVNQIGRAVARAGLRLADAPGGRSRPLRARGFLHF